jgi:hypothetical protein
MWQHKQKRYENPDILFLFANYECFEFGTAIAAPNCYKFCMQALSLALQLQRQFVRYSACKL